MPSSNLVKYAKEAVKEHPELFEALLEYERTGKLPKPNPKERANFTIDSKILREYRLYCKKHGYKMSARIERFIERELQKR
ncbi:hypothetical protein HYT51_01790 [Candidatus Woesearchaeota archaeon]|nr:hypothetical protein [Candidatus Woesearchaeota archaeon]